MIYNILLILVSCCLQAWMLEQYGNNNIIIIIQSLSLFITGILFTDNKNITINRYSIYQGLLYYISILFPYIAITIWPGKATYALGGLFRTSTPIFILISQNNKDYKYWRIAIISVIGLILSMDIRLYYDNIYNMLGVSICMIISSFSSALLGLNQHKYGNYLTEIGLLSIITSTIQYIYDYNNTLLYNHINNTMIYIIYLIISVMASYSVNRFHSKIKYDAFKLSLILSLRRSISCLLVFGLDIIRIIGVILVIISNLYMNKLDHK